MMSNDDDSAATLYRLRSSPSVRPQASRRSFPFTARGAGDGEPAAVLSTPPSPTPFEQGLARSGVALVFLLFPPPFPLLRIRSASRRMAACIRLRSSSASCAVTVSAKLGCAGAPGTGRARVVVEVAPVVLGLGVTRRNGVAVGTPTRQFRAEEARGDANGVGVEGLDHRAAVRSGGGKCGGPPLSFWFPPGASWLFLGAFSSEGLRRSKHLRNFPVCSALTKQNSP